MSDPNNSDPQKGLGSDESKTEMYVLITAYIDNEIKDPALRKMVENRINSDSDIYNRYIFEKLTKERLRQTYKPVQAPVYLQKSVANSIDSYIAKASAKSSMVTGVIENKQKAPGFDNPLRDLRKYFMVGALICSLLVVIAVGLNQFSGNPDFQKIEDLSTNDMVRVSREVFDKVTKGQIKPTFITSDAKALADSMTRYVGFKAFVPDVKDAVLIGGVCNEIEGEKLAHFLHKKGSTIIYTLQGSKERFMNNVTSLVMCSDFKEKVQHGENWIPCLKDEKTMAVIWFKDDVICSSVSSMTSEDIASVLTNYK